MSVRIRTLLIALIVTASLVPIGLLTSGQPSGYTLLYTPVQYFSAAPWMNVKNIYGKVDGSKLYWYIELGGAIPTTQGTEVAFYVYMDTDRSTSVPCVVGIAPPSSMYQYSLPASTFS